MKVDGDRHPHCKTKNDKNVQRNLPIFPPRDTPKPSSTTFILPWFFYQK